MSSDPTNSFSIQKFLGGFAAPLLTGTILFIFSLAFWYGVAAWKEWQKTDPGRKITVSGEGKIVARPDIAIFTASVITQAKQVKDAQSENTRRSNAVIEFLKRQGVKAKDIKTTAYNIFPQYQYERTLPCLNFPCPPQKPPQIASYEVRHTIQIKVRNLEKIDTLLDGVITSGANQTGSVVFDIDNKDAIVAEARKKAIDEAKEKARILAKNLGVRLGRIASFSEKSGGPVPIFAQSLRSGEKGVLEEEAAISPQVEPGEQEIKVNVSITYEFY